MKINSKMKNGLQDVKSAVTEENLLKAVRELGGKRSAEEEEYDEKFGV